MVCPICQERTTGSVVIRCGHRFCGNCINEWIARSSRAGTATCPVCRHDFVRNELIQDSSFDQLSTVVQTPSSTSRRRKGVLFEQLCLCPLCSNTFDGTALTICGHRFCAHCIRQWLEGMGTCPSCNQVLNDSVLIADPDFDALTGLFLTQVAQSRIATRTDEIQTSSDANSYTGTRSNENQRTRTNASSNEGIRNNNILQTDINTVAVDTPADGDITVNFYGNAQDNAEDRYQFRAVGSPQAETQSRANGHRLLRQQIELMVCPVCQERTTGSVVIRCGHRFCGNCINEWIARSSRADTATCPVCRHDFVRNELIQDSSFDQLSTVVHTPSSTSSERKRVLFVQLCHCRLCDNTIDGTNLTICGHRFCAHCIRQRLGETETCPSCNQVLNDSGLIADPDFDTLTAMLETQIEPSRIATEAGEASSYADFNIETRNNENPLTRTYISSARSNEAYRNVQHNNGERYQSYENGDVQVTHLGRNQTGISHQHVNARAENNSMANGHTTCRQKVTRTTTLIVGILLSGVASFVGMYSTSTLPWASLSNGNITIHKGLWMTVCKDLTLHQMCTNLHIEDDPDAYRVLRAFTVIGIICLALGTVCTCCYPIKRWRKTLLTISSLTVLTGCVLYALTVIIYASRLSEYHLDGSFYLGTLTSMLALLASLAIFYVKRAVVREEQTVNATCYCNCLCYMQ